MKNNISKSIPHEKRKRLLKEFYRQTNKRIKLYHRISIFSTIVVLLSAIASIYCLVSILLIRQLFTELYISAAIFTLCGLISLFCMAKCETEFLCWVQDTNKIDENGN